MKDMEEVDDVIGGEKAENKTTNRLELVDDVKKDEVKPSETSTDKKPAESAKPEEKIVVKTEEEMISKSAFLKRIKEEARKTKAANDRAAQLESELHETKTVGAYKSRIEKYIRDEDLDIDAANKLRSTIDDGSNEVLTLNRQKAELNIKPQKVENALEMILDKIPGLKPYSEEMRVQLSATTDMRLLDSETAVMGLAYETKGKYAEEILNAKVNTDAEEIEKKKSKVLNEVSSSSTTGGDIKHSSALTDSEKAFAAARGMNEETAKAIKSKRGGIPGCTC